MTQARRTPPTDIDHRMSAPDAVMWDIERDPVLRSTITAVAVLDRVPDWERLARRIEYASRVIPRFRERVDQGLPRLGGPRWVADRDFDLAYHLRRVRVPAPGTFRDALDLIEPLSAAAFDRARPLWEFTLVEGLADGTAAFVQKVHHTLTDGVGGIEIALSILDGQADAPEPTMPPTPATGTRVVPGGASAAIGWATRSIWRLGVGVPIAGLRIATDATLHPRRNAQRAGKMALSVGRVLAPVRRSASPILTERSLARRYDTIAIGMHALKAAGHSVGCTANDAFLAATVDGLRRYHEANGVDLAELHLTMPVNLRGAGDAPGGNHFAPVRFAVPASIDDPGERMQQLGQIAHRWRAEPALASSDAIATVLELLPARVTTAVFGAMLKNVDAVVTNVPGIPSAAYLAGSQVTAEYAFAPPTGAALNVSLVSHGDRGCIGIVADTAAVTDHELLTACLVAGFDQVLGLVGQQTVRSP